jgi:crossover junction endodeoxyribonuclease RuvC
MSIQYFIGIDPGKSGGLVALDSGGQIDLMLAFDRPASYAADDLSPARAVAQAVSTYGGRIFSIYLEKVSAMPGQGVSSMFSFGVGVGLIKGALTHAGYPFEEVPPQVWQKSIITPPAAAGDLGPKERAERAAGMIWGLDQFILRGRRTPHQGLIDAALIARYGLQVFTGQAERYVPGKKIKRKRPMSL